MATMQRLAAVLIPIVLLCAAQAAIANTYADALGASFLFYEAQRSGNLPSNNRVSWRGDSGLSDGSDVGVDLSGGYYDAGDNVKFGFPMAFSATMLSWGLLNSPSAYDSAGQTQYAQDAIRWATDYFIKCHAGDNVLYVQVGEANADHACWMKPEDMTTPRTSYKVDSGSPGSDVAAETAAALAAAAIVFQGKDSAYASTLIQHAEQLWDFAVNNKGKYSDSVQDAAGFYQSSGYQDELVWGAVWLYKATKTQSYLDYATSNAPTGTAGWFSWDDKTVGALLLLSQLAGASPQAACKSTLDAFFCTYNFPSKSTPYTPQGMMFLSPWGPNRYAANAAFIAVAYADYLSATSQSMSCGASSDLVSWAKSQIDILLGNTGGRSFVVGVGNNPPTHVHHRGASIPTDQHPSCNDGFAFYNSPDSNPNVITGALAGGPDGQGNYQDVRTNYQACTIPLFCDLQ
eukprot:jgi/Chlat1/8737/Chrsp9S00893